MSSLILARRPTNFTLNPGHPLSQGLVVAYLGLSAGGNDCLDSSPSKFHGTLTGFTGSGYTPADRWGWENGRAVIDISAGARKVATLGKGFPVLATDSWTISFRHKTSSYVSLSQMFGFGDSLPSSTGLGICRYCLQYSNDYYFWGGGRDWDTGVAFDSDGAWHHIVLLSNGTNLSLYRDGKLVAGPTARPLYDTASQYITFGSKHTSAASSPNSIFSDCLIFGSALTPGIISVLASPDPLYGGWIQSIRTRQYFYGTAAAATGGPFPFFCRRTMHGGFQRMIGG